MNSENYVQGGGMKQPSEKKGLAFIVKVLISVGVVSGFIFTLLAFVSICMAKIDVDMALSYTIAFACSMAWAFFGCITLYTMSEGNKPSIGVTASFIIISIIGGGILIGDLAYLYMIQTEFSNFFAWFFSLGIIVWLSIIFMVIAIFCNIIGGVLLFLTKQENY